MMKRVLTRILGGRVAAPSIVTRRALDEGRVFGAGYTKDAFDPMAFQFRMGAGFFGDVNRTHPFTVEPGLMDPTNPPTAYGQAVVVDSVSKGLPADAQTFSKAAARNNTAKTSSHGHNRPEWWKLTALTSASAAAMTRPNVRSEPGEVASSRLKFSWVDWFITSVDKTPSKAGVLYQMRAARSRFF